MDEKILARINQLERQILVHSYIYYKKDANIWDDHFYDEHCRELYKLITDNPIEARLADWAISFEDYDPSTGFSLPLDHPWVIHKGEYLYRLKFGQIDTLKASKEVPKSQKTLFNTNTKGKQNKSVETNKPQKRLF